MPHLLFQNKKIFYRTEGKGKPVILLHGFGEDGNIWNRQINLLKENNSLIIPDIPGSGQSEMLEGKHTIDDYAEVVKAVADETIFKNKDSYQSFSLIGHSMGGYITVAFAEKYPQLLNSFGLFHSSAFADEEQRIATRKKAIDFITKNGSETFLKTVIPNLFSNQSKEERPELIDQLLNISKNIASEALIQYYEAMILRPARISTLQSFPRPILFIIGKHDTTIPFNLSMQQCHLPAISSINILQHSAHIGMWEEEELSNSILKKFLEDLI
ncbi:MAG: alpha/beta hydrolase [Ginsengibacter sp.]